MADMPKKLPGLILVRSHAQFVAEGKKALFVKSEAFQKYVGKEVYVVAGGEVWAIITFAIPKKITIKQFESIRPRHRISDEERREWWGKKRTLYSYKIFVVESFIPPLKAEYEPGSQVFIREVGIVGSGEMESISPTTRRADREVPLNSRDGIESTEDFIRRQPRINGIRYPLAKTIGDFIEDDTDVARVLGESMDNATANAPVDDRPIWPVRQVVPGSYAEKIGKMRNILGRSNREVVDEPVSVKEIRKSVEGLDLLSRFKRKLQGHE